MKFEYQNLNVITTKLLHKYGVKPEEHFKKLIGEIRELIMKRKAKLVEQRIHTNKQANLDLFFHIHANMGVYYEIEIPIQDTAANFNQILYLTKTRGDIQIYLELQEREEEIKLNIFVFNKIFTIQLRKHEDVYKDNLCIKNDSRIYKFFLSIEKTESGFLSKPRYFLHFYFNSELICYQEVEFSPNSFNSYSVVDFIYNNNERFVTNVFWLGQNMSEINKKKVLQNLLNYNNFQINNDNIFLVDKIFTEIFGNKNKVIPQPTERKELLYRNYILGDDVLPSKSEHKSKKKNSAEIDIRKVENVLGIKADVLLTRGGRLICKDRGKLVVGDSVFINSDIETKSFDNFCFLGIFRIANFTSIELIKEWIHTYFLFIDELKFSDRLIPLELFIQNFYDQNGERFTQENFKEINTILANNFINLSEGIIYKNSSANKLKLVYMLYDLIFASLSSDIHLLTHNIQSFLDFYRGVQKKQAKENMHQIEETELLKFNLEKLNRIANSIHENSELTTTTLHINTHVNLALELIQDIKLDHEKTLFAIDLIFVNSNRLLSKTRKIKIVNKDIADLIIEKVGKLLDIIYIIYYNNEEIFTKRWIVCNNSKQSQQTCLLMTFPIPLVISLLRNNAIDIAIKLLNQMLLILFGSKYSMDFPVEESSFMVKELELGMIMNLKQILKTLKSKEKIKEFIIKIVDKYKIFFVILIELLISYTYNFANEEITQETYNNVEKQITTMLIRKYQHRISNLGNIEVLNYISTYINTVYENDLPDKEIRITPIKNLYCQHLTYCILHEDIQELCIPESMIPLLGLDALNFYLKESSNQNSDSLLVNYDSERNIEETKSLNICHLYLKLCLSTVKTKESSKKLNQLLELLKEINIVIARKHQKALFYTLVLIISKYINPSENKGKIEKEISNTLGLLPNIASSLYMLISCHTSQFVEMFQRMYSTYKEITLSSLKKLGFALLEIYIIQKDESNGTVVKLKKVFIFILKIICTDSKTKKNIKIFETFDLGKIKMTISEKTTSDVEIHVRSDHLNLKFNKSAIGNSTTSFEPIIKEVKEMGFENKKTRSKLKSCQVYEGLYSEVLREKTNSLYFDKLVSFNNLYLKFQAIEEDIINLRDTDQDSKSCSNHNTESDYRKRYRKILTYDNYQKGCAFSVILRNKETWDLSLGIINRFRLCNNKSVIKSLFEVNRIKSSNKIGVKLIKTDVQFFGILFVCIKDVVFIPLKKYQKDTVCFTENKEEYSNLTYKDLVKQEGDHNKAFNFVLENMFRIKIENIGMVFERRFVLRSNALEIFTHRKESFFIVFIQMDDYQRIRDFLFYRTDSVFCHKSRIEVLKEYYTPKWVDKKISTFKYLHLLNLYSGRTYCDVTQYPVYPWIYDFEANSQRNLRKPIGALNPTRALEFKSKYTSLVQADSEPYHYGSHYSSAPITCYYLIRLEPFYSLSMDLQGGKVDVANRLFHSISVSWLVGLTNMTDVKELIPELYYLPDMLLNTARYNLGIKQDGLKVNHVILPSDIKELRMGPDEFIRWHRNYLESDEVSSDIHHWIDLIFGFKQKGVHAKTALNTFNSLTYGRPSQEENIHLNDQQIYHFGQTPEQLFNKQHITRKIKKIKNIKENYFPTKCGVVKYKEILNNQQAPILNPLGKNRFIMIVLKRVETNDKNIKVLDTQTKKTLVVQNEYKFTNVSFIFKTTHLVFSSNEIPGVLFGQVVASETYNGVKLSLVLLKIPDGPVVDNVQRIITTENSDILLFINKTILIYYKGISKTNLIPSLQQTTPKQYHLNFEVNPSYPIGFCRKLKLLCIGNSQNIFTIYSLIRKRICHVVKIDKERLNIQNTKAKISYISVSQLGYAVVIVRNASKHEDLAAIYSVNGRYITHTSIGSNSRVELYEQGKHILISHKYCLIKYSLPSLKAEKSYIGGANSSIEIRSFRIDEQNSQIFTMDNFGNLNKIKYT